MQPKWPIGVINIVPIIKLLGFLAGQKPGMVSKVEYGMNC